MAKIEIKIDRTYFKFGQSSGSGGGSGKSEKEIEQNVIEQFVEEVSPYDFFDSPDMREIKQSVSQILKSGIKQRW